MMSADSDLMELEHRWEVAEERVDIVEQHLRLIDFDVDTSSEQLWEAADELYRKTLIAFEVYYDHKDRWIPVADRIALESELLDVINKSFDIVIDTCINYGQLKQKEETTRDKTMLLTLCCQSNAATIADIHDGLLRAYLDIN